MRRLRETNPRAALVQGRRGDTGALKLRLTQSTALSGAERRRLLGDALNVAEATANYELLSAVLEQAETDARADTLALVLNLADESHPHFATLLGALRDGERTLVLGALLEATRLEPDAERRLLRLKRLVTLIPQDSRSLYWPEAEALAAQGGDDAQLTLLGFVQELPAPTRPLTVDTLRRTVRKVQNAFKRAVAFVALADLVQLSEADLREAEVTAVRIPDETLRIMTLTRLSQLEGRKTG